MILATLCYIKDVKNQKILMLHRVKKANDIHKGKWNGLGGKMEKGESPEDCVIREVKEESGLLIESPEMKGVITFPEFDGTNDWIVFVFTAEIFKGKLINSNEGKLDWIPREELLGLNLWEGDKIFINWLDQDKFFSAKFNYLNGEFKNHTVYFY